MNNEQVQGVEETRQKPNKSTNSNSEFVVFSEKGIPDVLREFIRPDEDDEASIRLPARDGNRRIGMLTIPGIQYQAWKTCFPKGLEKGPQSRYRQSRRVMFAIDDLPADAPTSINTGEASVFSQGSPAPYQPADPQAPDYSVYLSTDAAKTPLHGIYAVYPSRVPKAGHTTDKRPCGIDGQIKGGVYNFTHTAEDVMKVLSSHPRAKSVVASIRSYLIRTAKTKEDADYLRNVEITLCLGRVFSAEDGIMALDFDGHHPPAGISNGTGYHEVSSSGTGDHILFRTEKELFPTGTNKIKRVIDGHEIELFYGKGNGMAISGRDATAGPIDLDTASEASKLIIRIRADADTPNKQENITSGRGEAEPTDLDTSNPITPCARSDDEIIYLVKTTAGKSAALWSGDTSEYPSPSEADAALMVRLAELTSENIPQMKRVFLQSELGKRAKAQRPDYLQRTAQNACKYVRASHADEEAKYNQFMAQFRLAGPEEDAPEDTYDYEAEDAQIADLLARAPATIKAAYDYYIATSPIYQPLFALESSIIGAGVVLSRNWVTDEIRFADYPIPPNTFNDYTIILAPTGHRKDAIKHFLADVIDNDDIPIRSGASGRTAIHKLLQMYPRAVVFQDEAGKNVASSGRDPSGIKQGAETYIMEVYGTIGKIMPSEFADNKDSPLLRPIRRQGLTFLRTSTPETFCDAITYASVRDGWMPRHRVIVSYRPRPKSTGAYTPDAITDPDRLLSAWRTWRDAHIGLPEVDTHRQAISPTTACVWGYIPPQGVKRNAEDMRKRESQYEISTGDPDTKEPVVMDDPIAIGWTPEAAAKISEIYAANEAIPQDNYTAMRYRKIAHIIKIAGIIAVLRDGVEYMDLMKIHEKYAQSPEGRKILAAEAAAKKEYIEARDELSRAEKSKAQDRDQRIQKARKAQNKAYAQRERAVENAEKKVRQPIRKEATAKFLGAGGETQTTITPEKGEAKTPIGKISAADVEWAEDYINLLEIGAKKLIDEKITELGFGPALDVMEDYIRSHGGKVGEARLIQKCAPIRAIDEKHGLPQFLDYCEKSGRVSSVITNRGRAWCIAGDPRPETTATRESSSSHEGGSQS